MTRRGVRMLLLALLAGTVAVLVFGPEAREHLRDMEKALSAGKKVDWWDDAALGIRYAAWINLGILTLLLATSGWWARSESSDLNTSNPVAWWQDEVRWFWPILFAVTFLGVGLRVPLASKSLWWDESWQMMQASHGRWKQDPKNPDQKVFQQHDWKRAAWYYQKPTNHAPMAVAQKASVGIWQKLTGAKDHEFSELAARTPALLGSAASFLLMGMLLRSWGRPGVGILAALLLALHPWALRYGVDARGYAFVLPMVLAALLAATRLVQTQGQNWWAWWGFAFSQFLWLWAYPQAALDLMMINLVLLILLLVRTEKSQRMRMVGRCAAVNLVAAVLFVQAFLPSLMQAVRWAGQETVSQPFSWVLVKSLMSHLILGIAPAWPTGVASAGLPSLADGATVWGLGDWVLWVVPMGLIFLWPFAQGSFGHQLKRSPWALLFAPVLGCLLFMLVCVATGQYFYPRFVISLLPVLVVFAGLVLIGGKARWAKAVVALVLAILLLPAWGNQLKVLLERPIAPLREVVDFLLQQHQSEQATLVACFGHGREILPLFSADIRLVTTLEELQALRQEAHQQGLPFMVAYGHEAFNRGMSPDALAHLNNENLYEEVAAFDGVESEFYYRVLKARNLSAAEHSAP